MTQRKENRTYSVYVHTCPDGMVYVGSTSLLPCRRYNGGEGYKGNPEFYSAITKWGWKNIRHEVVMECSDKETAKMFESVFICATLPEKSYNAVTKTPNNAWFEAYTAEGVSPKFSSGLITKSLGESADTCIVSRYEFMESNTAGNFSNCNVTEYPKQQKQSDMKRVKVKAQTMTAKVIKGVKIEALLDTRYQHNCGGYPVCIRLYKDRKYKYFPTEYVMTVSEFLDMHGQDEEQIVKMFNYYCDRVRNLGDVVSCTDIQAIPEYTQTSTASVGGTIADLFNEKISLCGTLGTAIGYRSTLNKINEAFPKGLKLTEISVDTANRFVTYMAEQGLNETTINIHLTKLKACVNYGIYKGYIKDSQYPFKRSAVEIDKVTVPKSKKRDMEYITKEDMRRIWDWFMYSPKVNRHIGMFLFSYLHGGINVADMINLRFDDFYFREGGFAYRRKKTLHKNDFAVTVPSTRWTDALLDRMGIVPTQGEYVFRDLKYDGTEKDYMRIKQKASTQINRAIYRLSDKLGLGDISMTTARHSFATIATKNRMPWTMVEAAMGHANNTVSGHYIGGFSIEEMRPDFEQLL